MRNKVLLFIISGFILFLLSGCGIFEKTYVVEADYPLTARKEVESDDTLTVYGLSDLREEIRRTVAGA